MQLRSTEATLSTAEELKSTEAKLSNTEEEVSNRSDSDYPLSAPQLTANNGGMPLGGEGTSYNSASDQESVY